MLNIYTDDIEMHRRAFWMMTGCAVEWAMDTARATQIRVALGDPALPSGAYGAAVERINAAKRRDREAERAVNEQRRDGFSAVCGGATCP